MTLLLSIIALVAGPFVYGLGRGHPAFSRGLDGFVFITIAGIISVFIVPDAIANGGLAALVFLGIGLGFPVAVERLFRNSVRHAHAFILFLAAVGLIVHATIDGIALLPGAQQGTSPFIHDDGLFGGLFSNQLALGVILHRLPVGMAIWWSVRRSFGTAAAIATFAVIVTVTAAGYWLGEPVAQLAETSGLAWFQAFVAGSLVHVVAFGVSHQHAEEDSGDAVRTESGSWAYRVGILLGMFFIFTAPQIH